MPEEKSKTKPYCKTTYSREKVLQEPEKTVIKALSLAGVLGGGIPCAVDVKNEKVIRIRPLHFDWKYTKEEINPWKFRRNGKTLDSLNIMKSLPSPLAMAYKKRVFSPNRILYPLKRIDWDPNGDRNTQNRGKSKYKKILPG